MGRWCPRHPPPETEERTWLTTTPRPSTEQKPKRGAAAAAKAKAATDVVRLRIAQLVWLVCVVAALILAAGALLIALGDANTDNDLVKFVLDVADKLDLGVFDREDGVKRLRRQERRDQGRPAQLGAGRASCG